VEQTEVYTAFSVELFASGASSIRTLRRLIELGYKLFEIPRLHAKLVLVSGQFVSIGSQNLTANGIRNREATGISTAPDDVKNVEALLEPWLTDRQAITIDMIDDVEAILPPITRAFREARRLADEAEELIRQREQDREAIKLLEEQKQVAALAKRRESIASARSWLQEFIPQGKVPLELAKRFLRRSVWWHSHSSGKPVRAPSHADRIEGIDGDWKILFGANYFLAGRAINRCSKTLEGYISSVEENLPWTEQDLINKLWLNVRGAVANRNGAEFSGYYPISGQDMMFGVTSIDVHDFVSLAMNLLPQEFRREAALTA